MVSDDPGSGQLYAIQARKPIAALRRATPGITIEIRWCPAHKGVVGNEKADEWGKIAAEEPDTRGAEWLSYSDRKEVRTYPRSLANLKREISGKKWAEARQWAGGRTSRKKYRIPESHKPDGAVARSTKRLALRYYQLKTGHARTGQYLHWAKVRPTIQCWWCQCPSQTRNHLFKVRPEWKMQQKVLWAEVQNETGRWKSRWVDRDLLADGCGRVTFPYVLFFFRGRARFPFVLSLCYFLCSFLGSRYSFVGQAWAEGKRGACNEPPRTDCGQETG